MGKFVIISGAKGPHFVLKAANGEPIGVSETYSGEAACEKGIESVKKCAPTAGVEDQTVEGFKNVPNPAFELYTGKDGQFYFRLRARNGENLIKSEGYKAKASALNGIESVKKNAPDAPVTKAE